MLEISTESQDFTAIVNKLVISTALANETYDGVFKDLCDQLVDAGLPLLRCYLVMQTLHPLVHSIGLTWVKGGSFTVTTHEHSQGNDDGWLRSPFYWMLSNKQPVLRKNLRDQLTVDQFPLFAEIQKLGGTDYLALITPFGDPKSAFEHQNGIVTSWVADAPGRFDEHQIESLKFLQPYVALVAKLSKQQHTLYKVVSAYLGEEIGRHVLEGQIRLGDVQRIPAVIWMCDLRDSTAMTEQLVADEYKEAVNSDG